MALITWVASIMVVDSVWASAACMNEMVLTDFFVQVLLWKINEIKWMRMTMTSRFERSYLLTRKQKNSRKRTNGDFEMSICYGIGIFPASYYRHKARGGYKIYIDVSYKH